jgi:hypothetical protein
MKTKFLQYVSNLFARWAGKARLCYICYVAISDYNAIVHDHHLCTECHARTRKLASNRRKERKQRKKLHDNTVLPLTFNPCIRTDGEGNTDEGMFG